MTSCNQRGDFVLHPSNYYKLSTLIEFTMPVYHQSYVVAHALRDLHSGKRRLTVLGMFNVDIWYVVFYLGVLMCSILFLAYQFRQQFTAYRRTIIRQKMSDFYRITRLFLKQQLRPYSKLRIYRICFILYAMYVLNLFNLIIVSNSFVSQNVAMDLNEIIYSDRQLMRTNKFLCLFEDSETLSFIVDSPRSSLLRKMYDQKFTSSNCLLNTQILNMDAEKLNKFERAGFLFTSYPHSVVTVSVFSSLSGSPYFISGEFFHHNHAPILRKSLRSTTKRAVSRMSLRFLEGGIYEYIFRSSSNVARQRSTVGKIFESLEELLNQNTFIANDFGSFYPLFFRLFIIELSILVVFVLSKIVKKMKLKCLMRRGKCACLHLCRLCCAAYAQLKLRIRDCFVKRAPMCSPLANEVLFQ